MSLISADIFPQCLPNCTRLKPASKFLTGFIVNCKNPNLIYSSRRATLFAQTKPTHLNNQNFMDTHCISILHKLKKDSKLDECLDYLKSILDKGFKPDLDFCTELIHDFLCLQSFEKAVEVVETLELFGEPDARVYSILIYGFCENQIVGAAVQVLSRMKNRGIRPNVDSYNYIIASLSRPETLDMAMKMLSDMQDANCIPNGFKYLILIGAKIARGETNEAVELIERVFSRQGLEPNRITYSKIVFAMCTDGQMDRAFDFIRSLKIKGYEPHMLPYNSMLYALLNGRRWKDAEKTIKEMLSTNYELDNRTYTITMKFLLRDGKIEEATNLLKLMMEKGLKPDGTFVVSVSKFYREGMLDFTVRAVDYMIACGCLPKIGSYHSILGVLCKNGSVDQAISIFEKLEEAGYSPNVGTYNIMINHLWNQGDRVKALEMASEMLDKGIEPNNNIYVTLISCLCKDGMIDEALALLRDMDTPNLSYQNVLLGLCKARRFDEAIQLLEEMVEKGCRPTANVCTLLIQGIVCVGRRAEARELTDQLFRMGLLSRMLLTSLNKSLL